MNEQYADNLNEIQVFPDGKIFRLVYDNVVDSLRLISKRKDYFDELRLAFSVTNPAAFFSQQYGYKGQDRLWNINQFGYFHAGLVFDVLGWIKRNFGDLSFVAISKKCNAYIQDVITPLKKIVSALPDFEVSNISDDKGINSAIKTKILTGEDTKLHEFNFRDYQRDSIHALITKGFGRGLIEIPTAGGKSYILANFIWNILKHINRDAKTLLLVPNVQLVKQFYTDLLEYGYDKYELAMFCGSLSKKDKKENDINKAKIIIANRQYVFNKSKDLPRCDILICDEVHTVLAKASQDFVSHFPATIKIGCSGTIPSDKYQLNTLVGLFGKIVHKENITSLQSSGFISKLKITTLRILDKAVLSDRSILFHPNSTTKYRPDVDTGIRFDDAVKAEHEYFAKHYTDLYKPVLDYVNTLDGNTLVLFDKIDIGTSIYDLYKETYPAAKAFYNDGSTAVDERETTRKSFEESDKNVLFANVQIMSTGVNIKRLHNVVFCFGSKSTVRTIQSIGRILRLYNGKDYANLIDVVFSTKYSERHYSERLSLYKEFYNKSRPDIEKTIELD